MLENMNVRGLSPLGLVCMPAGNALLGAASKPVIGAENESA